MFAYCLGNPTNRVDVGGSTSYDCKDEDANDNNNPLDDTGRIGDGKEKYIASDHSSPTGKHSPSRNPGGRHGGQEHRGMVEKVRNFFEKLGYKVSSSETRVIVDDSGRYRYPDLTVYDGNDTAYYVQVGRQNANGSPCSREFRAMNDLANTGIEAWFVPYN